MRNTIIVYWAALSFRCCCGNASISATAACGLANAEHMSNLIHERIYLIANGEEQIFIFVFNVTNCNQVTDYYWKMCNKVWKSCWLFSPAWVANKVQPGKYESTSSNRGGRTFQADSCWVKDERSSFEILFCACEKSWNPDCFFPGWGWNFSSTSDKTAGWV